MHPHSTDTVVMVPPDDFAFNAETAADNEFQQRSDDEAQARQRAQGEFAAMVAALRQAGVRVLLLPKGPETPPLPDAVFPNNWFSTWPDGRLQLYPMRTANRQAEVRPEELRRLLTAAGLLVERIATLQAPPGRALEGTGALVFDHRGRRVFAARSERCDEELVRAHAAELGYEPLLFSGRASTGRPFYHTNVLLSIGPTFAVLCPDGVPDAAERRRLLAALADGGRQIIVLSSEQTERHFCANLLALRGRSGEGLIALSAAAWAALEPAQRQALSRHGRPLPVAIPTLEAVGGGSARCMLAEVFLPRLSPDQDDEPRPSSVK